MPLRDILFLIFTVVLLAGLVWAAWLVYEQRAGPRLVERHATVNARLLDGLAWFLIDVKALLSTRSAILLIKATAALLTTAIVAAAPVAALWAAGTAPLNEHGVAAGVAALIWASVLEAPSMPSRIRQLRWRPDDESAEPAPYGHVVFTIVALVFLDLVAVILALAKPGFLSAQTKSAFIGVGFVALADIVSVMFGLAFSTRAEYPLAARLGRADTIT